MDLAKEDSIDRTGFHHAKIYGENDVVNIIKDRMPNISFWFLIASETRDP